VRENIRRLGIKEVRNEGTTIHAGEDHRSVAAGRSGIGAGQSEYGGLKLEQARRLKNLEKENGRLKKAVAELTLDK
jgi:putative transposase